MPPVQPLFFTPKTPSHRGSYEGRPSALAAPRVGIHPPTNRRLLIHIPHHWEEGLDLLGDRLNWYYPPIKPLNPSTQHAFKVAVGSELIDRCSGLLAVEPFKPTGTLKFGPVQTLCLNASLRFFSTFTNKWVNLAKSFSKAQLKLRLSDTMEGKKTQQWSADLTFHFPELPRVITLPQGPLSPEELLLYERHTWQRAANNIKRTKESDCLVTRTVGKKGGRVTATELLLGDIQRQIANFYSKLYYR